jgi:hypothetical protein
VISNISSSEDEVELSPSDFAYLRQADKRAFLLRRSSRDPNLWKTRYCILTDRLWIVNTHLTQHSGSSGDGAGDASDRPAGAARDGLVLKAASIALGSSILLQDVRPSYNYQHAVILNDARRAYYFRARSLAEQQGWISDIFTRILFIVENETLNLAEFITCDEEHAAWLRHQRAVTRASAVPRAAAAAAAQGGTTTPRTRGMFNDVLWSALFSAALADASGEPQWAALAQDRPWAAGADSESEDGGVSERGDPPGSARSLNDLAAPGSRFFDAISPILTNDPAAAANATAGPTGGSESGLSRSDGNNSVPESSVSSGFQRQSSRLSLVGGGGSGGSEKRQLLLRHNSSRYSVGALDAEADAVLADDESDSLNVSGGGGAATTPASRAGQLLPRRRRRRGLYTSNQSRVSASLRVSRRGLPSLWTGLCARHPTLARAANFLYAVQRYRDAHRHDTSTAQPAELWQGALAVFLEYLLPCLIPDNSTALAGVLDSRTTPLLPIGMAPCDVADGWRDVEPPPVWRLSAPCLKRVTFAFESMRRTVQNAVATTTSPISSGAAATDSDRPSVSGKGGATAATASGRQSSTTSFFSGWLLSAPAPAPAVSRESAVTAGSSSSSGKSPVAPESANSLFGSGGAALQGPPITAATPSREPGQTMEDFAAERMRRRGDAYDFESLPPPPILFDEATEQLAANIACCCELAPAAAGTDSESDGGGGGAARERRSVRRVRDTLSSTAGAWLRRSVTHAQAGAGSDQPTSPPLTASQSTRRAAARLGKLKEMLVGAAAAAAKPSRRSRAQTLPIAPRRISDEPDAAAAAATSAALGSSPSGGGSGGALMRSGGGSDITTSARSPAVAALLHRDVTVRPVVLTVEEELAAHSLLPRTRPPAAAAAEQSPVVAEAWTRGSQRVGGGDGTIQTAILAEPAD